MPNARPISLPQTPQQTQVSALIDRLAEARGRKLGADRRSFLRTSCGLASTFLAMNKVYGQIFNVEPAEAAEPEISEERMSGLRQQFIIDDKVHFVHSDYSQRDFLNRLGQEAARFRDNSTQLLTELGQKYYRFENFLNEIFLNSDTSVGLLSGIPFRNPADWTLTNDQINKTAKFINSEVGRLQLLRHSIITPHEPGWMEEVDRLIEVVRPTSWMGYPRGYPDSPEISNVQWRLDDEKLMYPFYEKIAKAGITTFCVSKGWGGGTSLKSRFPDLWQFATVDDLPRAARDWPQISFVIYNAALQGSDDDLQMSSDQFGQTGYIPGVSELAAIPEKSGVRNVYCDLSFAFARLAVTQVRHCAGMMGTLIGGLGSDHIFWGTSSVWYGSPQWQIEALRRLEIPEDMQKRHGFAQLGPADGMVKDRIFGQNAVQHYGLAQEVHH